MPRGNDRPARLLLTRSNSSDQALRDRLHMGEVAPSGAAGANDHFWRNPAMRSPRQNRPVLRTRFETGLPKSQRTALDYRHNLRCLDPTPAAPCDTACIHLAGGQSRNRSTARDRTQMSVKARVSRRGARDQTYGPLENTRVLEGLRLNIRDLHAGGENRVQAVETPRCTPVAG